MIVAIVGLGVRGSICAGLLAGAGVEELSLVDGGFVEPSDVGRHPLQFTPDVNASKSDALVAKLGLLNPAIHAQPFPADLSEENASAILLGASCVVDCAGQEDVSGWIESAAKEIGIPVIAPPAGYVSGEVTSAVAAAVGSLQADLVLALREADGGERAADVIRADGAAI
ncbi:MAG: ThiF family adenylyltransferase [Solirubrobacterales bacterium]